MSFISIPEIVLIQRENNATVIYTEKDSYVTSASMAELERKLDPEQFLRSHKLSDSPNWENNGIRHSIKEDTER